MPVSRRVGLAYLVAGLGYIGAELASRLLAAGETVVGLENFFSTDAHAVHALAKRPGFSLVRGSITSPVALDRAFATAPIDTVFLLAAQASAHPDAAGPRYTEATNLTGPRLLLEAAVAHGVRTVAYASSMRIYGDLLPWHAQESECYGRFADLSHLSKVYAEKLLEMYAHQRGVSGRSVRLGLVYGVGPVVKTDPRFMTAPNKFCWQAARGEEISISNSGLSPQGLIHVSDAAEALLRAASLATPVAYLAVNAATESASMLDVALAVTQAAEPFGLQPRITVACQASTEAAVYPPIPSRLGEAGFKPRRQLVESLPETLAYFVQREGRR